MSNSRAVEAQKEQNGLGSVGQVLQRLDRVENKLDGIQKALVQMARTEERVVHLMEVDAERAKRIHSIQDQVTALEKELIASREREYAEREHKIKAQRMTERGIWAFVTGAVSLAVGFAVAWFKGETGGH
jgi:hypothetical protein